jgi:hypothetical protein
MTFVVLVATVPFYSSYSSGVLILHTPKTISGIAWGDACLPCPKPATRKAYLRTELRMNTLQHVAQLNPLLIFNIKNVDVIAVRM